MTFCIGLTGGIGCGKSTVAALFSQHGAGIVDTDDISHRLTGPAGAALPAIRSHFGDSYIDDSGALDRAAMRKRVFSDPTAKHALEHILHPLIRTQAFADAERSDAPYVLLVVPLLFETNGYSNLITRTLVVDCAEKTQIERVMQRSHLSEAEVRAIMSQQMDRGSRIRCADDVLNNEASLSELEMQVSQLHARYLALARQSD